MWIGQHNVTLGGVITGIGYRDEETKAALITRFGPTIAEPRPEVSPPAFGVERVRVGLTRRPLCVVRHGLTVHHRSWRLDAAAGFLHSLIDSWNVEPEPGEILLPYRVFVSGEDAILVDVPAGFDLDERPLWRRDVAQLPLWSARVDPSERCVRHGDSAYRIAGIVVVNPDYAPFRTQGDLYNHVWAASPAPSAVWAWAIDDLGARVVESTDPTREILRQFASLESHQRR